MDTKKGLLLIGSVVAGAYGLGFLARQYALLKKTEFKILSASTSSEKIIRVDMSIQMEITNKSDLKFNITRQKYDFYVNGIFCGNAQLENELIIEKNAKAVFGLPVAFNPLEVLHGIGSNLSSNLKETKLSIRGRVTTKTVGILFNSIPVNVSFTLGDVLKK